MICPKCGKEIEDGNLFCPMCGIKLENVEQITAQPEKKAPKINKKIIIGAVIAVCLIGVVIGISEYNAQPSTKYKKAEAAFASGEYEKALKLYTAAGAYEDSPQKAGQAQVCIHYEKAKDYMSQGEYDTAISELEATKGYEDTAQLIQQCHYEKGVALLDASEYEVAAEEFAASEKYMDADDKIIEMGEALTQNGEYELAVSVFEKTSISKNNQYLDYSKASIDYQEKKYADAAKLYKAADKVLDSEEKFKECEYEAGKIDLDNTRYSSAKGHFQKVTEYKDSKDLINACDLLMARGYINEGKINTAKDALEKLPEDFVYKEASVSALKERLVVCDKWSAVSGKWTSTSGKIQSKEDNSYRDHWWYIDFNDGNINVDLTVTCVPREDGSAKVTVTGQIPIFTNYSAWKEYLTTEAKTISASEVMKDFGTITADSNTTVKIAKDGVTVNYKYVDNGYIYNKYIYTTDVKYGKRSVEY